MEELKNPLFTTKYTKVFHEDSSEIKFNAPHTFSVVDAVDTNNILSVVHFQEGPIKENGINGIANEDLILMVVTRLQGFQNSPFACRENAVALTKLEEAAMWLRKRTTDREARQVEGTSTV